jgi:hypothetical protein
MKNPHRPPDRLMYSAFETRVLVMGSRCLRRVPERLET